jgi:hypothetical protein
MENFVHPFVIFKTIFYSKFLEHREVKFGSNKIWKNLNVFKLFEFFETLQTAPPVTVAPGPLVSTPATPVLCNRALPTRARQPQAGAGR